MASPSLFFVFTPFYSLWGSSPLTPCPPPSPTAFATCSFWQPPLQLFVSFALCSHLFIVLLGEGVCYQSRSVWYSFSFGFSFHLPSIKMVCCWFAGDVFKTVYFIVKHAPAQFWVCGIIQVTIDIAILIQVFYYTNKPPQKVIKIAATEDVHISWWDLVWTLGQRKEGTFSLTSRVISGCFGARVASLIIDNVGHHVTVSHMIM